MSIAQELRERAIARIKTGASFVLIVLSEDGGEHVVTTQGRNDWEILGMLEVVLHETRARLLTSTTRTTRAADEPEAPAMEATDGE